MASFFKVAIFLVLFVGIVFADINVNIPSSLSQTLTPVEDHFFGILQMDGGNLDLTTGESNSQVASGVLSPCVWHYWRLDASQWASDFSPSDYLHVNVTSTNDDFTIPLVADFTLFVRYTTDGNSWDELPRPDQYDYSLVVSAAVTDSLSDNWLEIPPCRNADTGFFWFALGLEPEQSAFYTLEVSRRRPLGLMTDGTPFTGSQIDSLSFGVPFPVLNDTRLYPGGLNSPFPTYGNQGNQEDQDRIRQWRYFSFTYSASDYAPGAYIVVNVSNVTTYSQNPFLYEDYSEPQASFLLAVNFETVPYYTPNGITILSSGTNECTLSACTPNCNSDCSTPLEAYCDQGKIIGDTASLTILPGSLQYGTYYVGVRLPTAYYDAALTQQYIYLETSYTVSVDIIKPDVQTIPTDGTPVYGFAPLTNYNYLTAADYYRFTIDAASAGRNLAIRVTNINGDNDGHQAQSIKAALRLYDGTVGQTPDYTLPNVDVDGCSCYDYTDTTCTGCEECRITLFSCQVIAADYFLAIYPSGSFAPIEYELTVTLYDDPAPEPITAGVPVFGSIGYGEYNFYELNVPETTDTSLFVELFVNNAKSPVSVQMLYNATPGETCYPQPDFKCQSDVSCYFFVESCLLRAGAVYFSVYGLDDKIGYSVSTDYTLWVDFETAWELTNNVTYSDHVRVGGYNHYYLRAENVVQGSWLTVEVDNIDGTEVNAYINYQSLAGECPCYASFRNCTGLPKLSACPPDDETCTDDRATDLVQWDLDTGDDSAQCCKLEVDGCSFRDGLWYVSVHSSEDPFADGADPQALSGYTITAIIHPPPVVYQLALNRPLVDWVNPFTLNHYRLVGQYAATEGNLVLTLTWMQDNCGRFTEGGNYYFDEFTNYPVQQLTDNGNLILRVQEGALALPECYSYPYSCSANTDSTSSCTVIIPWCVWSTWKDAAFVSVDYQPQFDDNYAQFTLRAAVEVEPVIEIMPDVSYHGVVAEDRYVHYTLDVRPLIENNYRLELDVYYNTDRHTPLLNLQINAPAGGDRPCTETEDCQTSVLKCTSDTRCHWDFDPCEMAKLGAGEWYFTFYGQTDIYYNVLAEFTLEANFVPAVFELELDAPRARHSVWTTLEGAAQVRAPAEDCLSANDFGQVNLLDNEAIYVQRHYRIILPELPGDGSYYEVTFSEFAGSSNGHVTIYHNVDSQAGLCDCYSYLDSKTVDDEAECSSAAAATWTFSDCDGFVAGVHYFSVYGTTGSADQINFQVQARTIQPIVTRDFGTITNTDGNGNVFHLGTGSLLYLDDLADNIDAWILWNSANEKFDETYNWQMEYLYYTFTLSADDLQVFYALYNVVQPPCDYDVTMNFDFIGAVDSTLYCDSPAVVLCTDVGPGSDDDGARVPCYGAIDRCLTSTQGQYAVRFSTDYALPPYDGLTYDSYIGSSSFNFKLFTQTPIQFPSTLASETNPLNITYYFHSSEYSSQPAIQEFELTDVIISGNAPMTQIVFRNVAGPITIYLRPAPLAGEPGDYCEPNCYDESCIEIRGGFPISNVDFFDATVTDKPSLAELGTYGFQCGAASEPSDCTVSLLPCALLGTSTTWFMAVEYNVDFGIQSDSIFADNVYQVYWFNLGDRRTGNPVDSATIDRTDFIDTRERYPGPEFCSDPSCPTTNPADEEEVIIGEMDSFYFFNFDITSDDVRQIFNGTKDNSVYTQLEIQIYEVAVTPSDPSFGQANWIAYISQGETPVIPTINSLPSSLTSTSSSCCGSAWTCYGGSCDARDAHFVVPPCCLQEGTYWITVRLITPGEHGFRVRVRLVDQSFSTSPQLLAEFVDSQNFGSGILTPSTYPSIVNGLTNDQSGVEPNNFIHYYTTILDSQISNGESLIFNMSIDDDSTAIRDGNPITLFIRRGAPAGHAYNSGADFSNQDYCLGETYSCSILVQDEFCVIEIPNCQLFADDFYFSIWQDGWFSEYSTGLTDPTASEQSTLNPRDPFYNNLGFELNVYFRPAAYTLTGHTLELTSDVEVCTNHTEGGLALNTLHYLITIDESAITSCGGSASTSPECLYENTLVIEVWSDDVTVLQDMSVYLSTPNTLTTSGTVFELAAQPGGGDAAFQIPDNSASQCPASLTVASASETASNNIFYWSTSACDDFDLRSGDYYLSISLSEYRSYSICTHIEHPVYTTFNTFSTITPPSDIDDETASLLVGTDDYFPPSNTANDVFDFYYKFTISEDQANDQLNYLQVQVTDVNDCTDTGFTSCSVPVLTDFSVTVYYNENCESWTADATDFYPFQVNPDPPSSLQTGTFLETVIDEAGLVLCSLRAGTYRIHVANPASYGFTINVLLRHALSFAASFDAPVYSQIWQAQYQVYSLEITDTVGSLVVATLDEVSCGSLELWAKYGNVAGPSENVVAHVPAAYSSCEYCANYYCATGDDGECWIAIGDVYGGVAKSATWYFTVHGVKQDEFFINDQVDPITYRISFEETGFTFVTDTYVGCPFPLTYPDTYDCPNSAPAVPHQQFVFDFELDTIFSWARLTFTPNDGTLFYKFDLNETVFFAEAPTSGFGASGSISAPASYLFGGAHSDDTDYQNILYGPTQFNVWVEGPVDSTITLERWLPYVPTVHPQVHYESSIHEGTWQYYKLTSLSSDYNALYITSTRGTIGIDFVAWRDFFTQVDLGISSTTVTVPSDTTYPSPFSIPSGTTYLAVYGVSESCDYPCQAIEYSFWYNNFIAHDSIDCDTFQCDSVGDVWEAEYHIYDVEPFDPLANYDQDVNYTVTVQQVIVNGFDEQSSPDTFYTQLKWPVTGAPTSSGWTYGGYSDEVDTLTEPTICAFNHFTVHANNGYDAPCHGSDFEYQLEYKCVDLPVQDITTLVITTGYTYCSSTEEFKLYSFDLRDQDLEFALLDVYLDGDAILYQNLNDLADAGCQADSCTVQNSVYFYTIRAQAGAVWTFYARLVTVPPTQLTLGQSSPLISFPNTNYLNYQVYYVDVPSGFSVDSYLQFEVLSYSANNGGDFQLDTLLTDDESIFYLNHLRDAHADCDCVSRNRYTSTAGISPLAAGTIDRAVDAENAIVINHCKLDATRYYLWAQAPSCNDVNFRIRPLLLNHNIPVLAVPSTSQSLISQFTTHEYAFYSVQAGTNPGQIRLSNVLGGHLSLYALADKLPQVADYLNINGPGLYLPGISAFQGTPNDAECPCVSGFQCTTISQDNKFDNLNDDCVSCAVLIPDCVWTGHTWYMGIRVASATGTSLHSNVAQYNYFEPVQYVLSAGDEPFTTLSPTAGNSFSLSPASPRAAFAAGNWQHFLYSFSTDTTVQSITVQIAVTGTEPQDGVYATLSTDSCFQDGNGYLLKNVWCSAEYDNWVCEFQIPTRGEHTGATDYYIDVYGRRGTFSLTVVLGSNNCEVPTGLDFCASYVNHTVWAVNNYAQLDTEASCRYETIKGLFDRVDNDCTPDCWQGINDECDDLLKRFSCYESFPPCDLNGFITSTCGQFCDYIESTCDIAFASVGLQQYDCLSSHYIDQNAGVCAGDGFVPESPFDF
jgi:hypothetical protein